MTIHYEPQNLQISFIFRWKGTIFPLVLSDPMFWFLLIVHVGLLLWDGKLLREDGEGLPPLDWQASTVAMGLLTFFLVFCMLDRHWLSNPHILECFQAFAHDPPIAPQTATTATVATLSCTAIVSASEGQ